MKDVDITFIAKYLALPERIATDVGHILIDCPVLGSSNYEGFEEYVVYYANQVQSTMKALERHLCA